MRASKISIPDEMMFRIMDNQIFKWYGWDL